MALWVCLKIENFPYVWVYNQLSIFEFETNDWFFLTKAMLGICIDLHRNQSFLKSYSAFSSPSLAAVAGLWPGRPTFKEELTSRMCRGPRVSSELLGATSMVLYPLRPCDSGCYHHFRSAVFLGKRFQCLSCVEKPTLNQVVYFVDW